MINTPKNCLSPTSNSVLAEAIPQELSHLDEEISLSLEAIHILGERLQPVSHTEAEKDASEKEAIQTPNTNVAERIRRAAIMVNHNNALIRDLTKLLDI